MSSSKPHPKWWQLYLLFPLLIVLFVVDARLRLSVHGHQAAQLGILLLIYGLIYVWLKTNASALSRWDQRRGHGRITVMHIPVSRLPGADTQTHSVLDLPASEIKGMLSDAFEGQCIDAEALPIDEFSRELKKE